MIELSKAYQDLFEELRNDKYATYNVYGYFIEKKALPEKEKINVILRIDVDDGLELCDPLSSLLKEKGINASFFFLAHPDRYYDIWDSNIPEIVRKRGFEVGLHTDHYFGELVFGKNAIETIKKDINRLSELAGEQIKGMVFHGHDEMDALGRSNCDIYRDKAPKELGLVYHDFTVGMGSLRDERFNYYRILDYLNVQNGWRYYSSYPTRKLRRLKKGDAVVIFIHPANAFVHEKRSVNRRLRFSDLKHFLRIRLRYQLIDSFIKGDSARLYLYNLLPSVITKLFKNIILRKNARGSRRKK